MKDKVDNYLDDLAKKVIKDTSIESTPSNFTDVIMSQVNILNKSKLTVYKPLISKTTWGLILVGFLTVIFYVLLFGTQTETSGWLSKIDFSALPSKDISLPSFKISKTFMYAFVLFGIMVCIQIPFLKSHFNKRYDL